MTQRSPHMAPQSHSIAWGREMTKLLIELEMKIPWRLALLSPVGACVGLLWMLCRKKMVAVSLQPSPEHFLSPTRIL